MKLKKNGYSEYHLKSVKKVLDELRRFPGVGPRLAERIVDFIIEEGNNYIEKLSDTLKELSRNVKCCNRCFGYAEDNLCAICSNPKREQNMLCVVQYPRDVLKLESLKEYNGLYFVLGNLDINNLEKSERLKFFKERVGSGKIKEVILALGTDFDSTFVLTYLTEKILMHSNILVSHLSVGVPFGYPIEFVDTNTLSFAFKQRKYIR
jgi:recombination protein RecR